MLACENNCYLNKGSLNNGNAESLVYIISVKRENQSYAFLSQLFSLYSDRCGIILQIQRQTIKTDILYNLMKVTNFMW